MRLTPVYRHPQLVGLVVWFLAACSRIFAMRVAGSSRTLSYTGFHAYSVVSGISLTW